MRGTSTLTAGAFDADATLQQFDWTDAPEGGWPGYTGAVYRDGVTHFGYVDSSGNVKVRSIEDGVLSSATTLRTMATPDHHDYPELLVREDGYLVTAYCPHNGSALYVRISSNVNDSSAWGSEANIDASVGEDTYTYPRLRQLTAEANDPIYLFIRSGGGSVGPNDLTMSKSLDGGATWSAATKLWSTDPNGHYFRVSESGGSRLDFLVSTGNSDTQDGDVYHFWYEGGSWYDSAGNDMGSPPFTTSDATLVYEAAAGQGVRVPQSIERRADGHIVGTFQAFSDSGDLDTWYDNYWAEWDGASWSTEVVAASDARAVAGYGGGRTHMGPYVYISRYVGGTAHLFRYRKTANGWESIQLTTTGGEHIYPVPVRDGVGPLRILWLEGTYTDDPYAYSWGINGGW